MQNENKHQHWKQKLADTESLSAELRLNKNAAWEKLQHRLQQKPKRRKAGWYWLAAACALPFILFFSYSFLKQNNTAATITVNKPATTEGKIKAIKPAQKEMNNLTASVSSIKKKAVIKKKMNDDITPAIIEEKKNEVAINPLVSSQAETSIIAIDSPAITPITMQTKKRLKVVHINELGEPDKEATYLARDAHVRSFSLQIAREETYLSPLKTTRRTGFINLKILSPSN